MNTQGLIIDNFAGGGGASTGIEMALGRPVDIAINHDLNAITMHAANHPDTLHLTEDVFQVNPRKVCKGRAVDVAWFSPDCTHFSKAKGSGITRSRKIRGLAWVAAKWAAQVSPRVICLENVEEFMTWGPLKDGTPNPKYKGAYFRKFVARLRTLGYDVEWKTLVAADFGAPTSRKRFFLIARCDGLPIVWPEPTHGPGRTPYRTAAECIDWSIPTVSIFATKEEAKKLGINCIRPLAENTLKRIARGVMKFIVNCENTFILNDEQLAAFMSYHYTGHDGYDVRVPLKTVTAWDHHALVAATLTKYHGGTHGKDRAYSVDDPMKTVDTANRFGIVTAVMVANTTNNPPYSPNDPLKTVTTGGHHAIVVSYLTKYKGDNIGADLREPVQTITAGGLHHAQVSVFLIKYYGQGIGQQASDPLATITSKEKFGLVTIRGEKYAIADIGMRMLSPRELARAQGLPDSFVLTGTRSSQVARIGNMVPPDPVCAILKSNVTWQQEQEAEAA